MPRYEAPRIPESLLFAIGDSLTDARPGFPVAPNVIHPSMLARMLRMAGCNIRARNAGVSGNTTTQMLARMDAALGGDFRWPDLVLVMAGVNDPGSTISQATTQQNIEAMLQIAKHSAYGILPGGGATYNTLTYATPSALPGDGQINQRAVVLNDNDSTGGVAADPLLIAQNGGDYTADRPWLQTVPSITGAGGGKVSVWQCRNPLAGVYGWGRVALPQTPHGDAPTSGAGTVAAGSAVLPWRCERLVVISAQYLNYTTGGDTLVTPFASYATVRAAQQAAATAQNVNDSDGHARVVFSDLYTFMRSRIAAGTDPDFSAVSYDQTRSWHIAQNNQHFSSYGQKLVADCNLAAIPSAWIDALQ